MGGGGGGRVDRDWTSPGSSAKSRGGRGVLYDLINHNPIGRASSP